MSRGAEEYSWAAYYAAAYEKERKQNIILAERIADAERRQADLSDNLNRICATPFWKATVPFRKMQQKWMDRLQENKDRDRCSEKNACLLRYAKEVQRQKQPYQEWLSRMNNGCYICDGKKRALHDGSDEVKEAQNRILQDRDTLVQVNEELQDGAAMSVSDWQAVRVPESDIVLLTYGGGALSSGAFAEIKSYFDSNKSCIIAYTDEDFYWEDLSQRMQPWFKPCYSPDTLLAYNYWGHLVAVRENLLTDVLQEDGVRNRNFQEESFGQAAKFYNLCLYLEEAVMRQEQFRGISVSDSICHVPAVLFHQPYLPDSKAREAIEACDTKEERFIRAEQGLIQELEAGLYLTGAGKEYVAVREAALYRRGRRGRLQCGPEPDLYHIVYDTSISGRERCARAQSADRHIHPHPLVSVVIPSKDHPEILEQCLKSFRKKTLYGCYEWIVVDNGSSEENRARILKLQQEYGFMYLYEKMSFNFSRMCNMGAAKAQGDLLLFLNDDIEIIEKNWLGRMVGQAIQPHAGAVGAKLWYAGTRQIQHAGITNLKIGPSHKLVTFQDDRDYYYGRNRVTYNMIGVTAACLMVAKSKYRQVGGFDEEMAVSYNDVEFCFKLAEAGYYNVLRNDAVLCHHESLSRGLDEFDENKWERLLKEKEHLYARHPQMEGKDPFYHKDLIDNASDYRCNYKFAHEDSLSTRTVEPLQEEALKRIREERLILTIDRAEMQHKIWEEEPDIVWIMGWCYVPGEDNAFYDKQLLLQRKEETNIHAAVSGTGSAAGGMEHKNGAGYAAIPADWCRRDVAESLRGESHIELAGFVLRVLKQDLENGTYRIGMLCTNQVTGEKALAWSDKEIEVEAD